MSFGAMDCDQLELCEWLALVSSSDSICWSQLMITKWSVGYSTISAGEEDVEKQMAVCLNTECWLLHVMPRVLVPPLLRKFWDSQPSTGSLLF